MLTYLSPFVMGTYAYYWYCAHMGSARGGTDLFFYPWLSMMIIMMLMRSLTLCSWSKKYHHMLTYSCSYFLRLLKRHLKWPILRSGHGVGVAAASEVIPMQAQTGVRKRGFC
jgi:hypothetical protein